MKSHSILLKELLSEYAISEEEFANCLGIDYALAESVCSGKKQLNSTLARQIEQTFSKPKYWLDSPDSTEGPSHDLFG